MSARRHPTDDQLQAWLSDDHVDEVVDEHLSTCETCATRLEQVESGSAPVVNALELITRPPENLRSRLETRFAAAALQEATSTLVGELFGLGAATLRVLMDPPPDPKRPDQQEEQP